MDMNNRITIIKNWLNERTPRESVLLFVLGLTVLYLFWNLIAMRPVLLKEKKLLWQISEQQTQTRTVQNEIDKILKVVNSPAFFQILEHQKRLAQRSKSIKQHLSEIEPFFVSVSQLSQITKDILGQQNKNVVLSSFKMLPVKPLVAENKEYAGLQTKKIYQYGMQIEFRATYFNAIEYLRRIEKLRWHLYWDSLNYKVTDYPEANVIIEFHALSNQKS